MENNKDMRKRMFYKGYLIEPHPDQLAESKEWTISLSITLDRGSSVNILPFNARNTFPTEEEACKHCYILGRQIIDGEVPGCSIDGL